ncbi:MAG: tetratricopeptide repeat protein [Vicingaceae bacterium]|nr:tetratricopeptide repeat protein [Vicingaceae bacterium]
MLFSTVSSFTAQNYFDSLTTYIQPLSNEKKVELIKAIPFDKMNSNTSAAIHLYQKALDYSADNQEQQAIINEKLALAYYYKGDYDLSVQTSLAAINQYEKLNNQLKVGSVYASLGYQMKRRNLPKAFQYMRKGIFQLEQIDDQKALSAAYNNFGVLHEMDNDIDSALYYYQKGLKIVEEINDSIGIPYSLNNIAGAYVIQGNYKKALPYYEKAFSIRKKRNDLNGMAENYTAYGDFYFKQELYPQAISNYIAADSITQQIKYTYLQKVCSEQLALCYSFINEYKSALNYQKKAVELNDILLNESSNKSIAELETQFETEKKEKQIIEQNVVIANKEYEIKQRSYFMYALISIGVLLIIVGFFIIKGIRFKQQKLIESNRLKDEIAKIKTQEKLNEERVRISRDLHDNIGAQLTFIISSIDNMSFFMKETNNELKTKLQELNEFSRKAIKELRGTINTLNKSK